MHLILVTSCFVVLLFVCLFFGSNFLPPNLFLNAERA